MGFGFENTVEKPAIAYSLHSPQYGNYPHIDNVLTVPGFVNGYKLVEYVQSDGSQYINTGIVPNQTYAMELDFQPTNKNACIYAGSRSGEDNVNKFTINCASNSPPK